MDKKCSICDCFFKVKPSHYDIRLTCSRACRGKHDSIVKSGVPLAFPTWTKKTHPEVAKKLSESMKGKVNLGDNNGMKQKEAQAKVSAARREMFKDVKLREITADKTRRAWAEGKFDGVRVGRCKWYSHTKPDGLIIKVQGTWELKFAEWADSKQLIYDTHKGRIAYKDCDGNQRSYYPDFYVYDWCCWVDIKNDFHAEIQKEKFIAIAASNPSIEIRILKKLDLQAMGIVV